MKRNLFVLKLVIFMVASFLFLGCNDGHDTSSLKKAFLGHWVKEEWHYYIGPELITSDYDGKQSFMDYEIVELDEKNNWIIIHARNKKGFPSKRGMVFSKDRKSFREGVQLLGEVIPTGEWKYLDDKQSPNL